jgi:hypothetical protein
MISLRMYAYISRLQTPNPTSLITLASPLYPTHISCPKILELCCGEFPYSQHLPTDYLLAALEINDCVRSTQDNLVGVSA